MKAGDKVWAVTTVVSVEPNGVIYGDWDMHDPACVIPDHPALPKVAAWLAEHGADELRKLVEWDLNNQVLRDEARNRLRALLAALTTEEA